jgi:hypothetical protein
MKKIAFFLLFWVCINQAFSQNNNFPFNAKAKTTQARENISVFQLLKKAEMLNQKHEDFNNTSIKASVFHMDSMYNGWDGNTDLSVFQYDSLNRLEKEDIFFVDGSGNKFHYLYLDLHYNANNKRVKKVFWMITPSYVFDTIMYIDYTYNTNNRIVEEFWHDKDDSTGLMFLEGKFEYSYDGIGNITEITISDWDTTATNWVLNQKFNYSYNASSQIIEYVEQDWDTLSNTWEYETKYENIYDIQGNKTDNIEYRYTGTAWENAYKEVYTHNGQNLLIERNRHTWDNLSSTWLPSNYKDTFQYNINGSLIESNQYKWVDSTSTWDDSYRIINLRNENYTAQDIILPYHCYFFGFYYESPIYVHPYYDRNVLNFLFNDMLLKDETKRWMPNDSIWKTIDEFIYYYSDHTASIEQDKIESIKVYPNPAKDYISFDINNNTNLLRFTLLDLSGRQILDMKPTSNTIYLDNLSTGMYLYKVDTEDGVFSGKISVIR